MKTSFSLWIFLQRGLGSSIEVLSVCDAKEESKEEPTVLLWYLQS